MRVLPPLLVIVLVQCSQAKYAATVWSQQRDQKSLWWFLGKTCGKHYRITDNFRGLKICYFCGKLTLTKNLPTKTYRNAPNTVHVRKLTKFLLMKLTAVTNVSSIYPTKITHYTVPNIKHQLQYGLGAHALSHYHVTEPQTKQHDKQAITAHCILVLVCTCHASMRKWGRTGENEREWRGMQKQWGGGVRKNTGECGTLGESGGKRGRVVLIPFHSILPTHSLDSIPFCPPTGSDADVGEPCAHSRDVWRPQWRRLS